MSNNNSHVLHFAGEKDWILFFSFNYETTLKNLQISVFINSALAMDVFHKNK